MSLMGKDYVMSKELKGEKKTKQKKNVSCESITLGIGLNGKLFEIEWEMFYRENSYTSSCIKNTDWKHWQKKKKDFILNKVI